jgi:hypothetical protein
LLRACIAGVCDTISILVVVARVAYGVMIGVVRASIVRVGNTIAIRIRRWAAIIGTRLRRAGIHVIREPITVAVRRRRAAIIRSGFPRARIDIVRKAIAIAIGRRWNVRRHLDNFFSPCGPKQVHAATRQDDSPDD